nr:dTDP-4-dehydrorhamnose 3,5-epimerase [Anaerolineae bacterium]
MTIIPLKLPGAYEITLSPIEDERGYFVETYRADLFAERGMVIDWVQDNQSLSRQRGVVRGLHFQLPPHTQTKLLRALSGVIWDVFVDLRTDSPTFGQWDAVELSAAKMNLAYVPKGFAHGFSTLTDNCILSYKVDAYYAREADTGILWNSPSLAIPWPAADPLLSEKDRSLIPFAAFVSPFRMAP